MCGVAGLTGTILMPRVDGGAGGSEGVLGTNHEHIYLPMYTQLAARHLHELTNSIGG